ncbi:AlkA N-terminal domain-containing protein [Oscillatoria sp. CS-180]|uniref:DNA-3-methyladenine glycosylase 2 family protein n=1 Tax=Oscillatoria sp. CS-180 TaxID=3021720 RepID=UPI00232CF0A0|nr:AlkA N-terminal domain-containing protein [Oscillatoria sp. CS-180]MDB9528511.1 AlkA N-terminal domain-containing protein [Oscillatoria sp. CS-180]
MLTDDQRYQALLSKDPRFDGIFFVGVSSTGIYCRTICKAKSPHRKNCTFYPSAAAAERAGYRPCLLCRPELAPGRAKTDAIGRLAAAAANQIESGVLTQYSVSELANRLGISDRHLRRVLQQEFGVSPIQLAQTQRLLLAKRLLTDSHLSIADIAFASGFSSVRRLNTLFKDRYHLSPTALRRKAAKTPQGMTQDSLYCELAYRPPFDWQRLLSFLRQRAVTGVEVIDDDRYQRTVQIGPHRGWIAVSPARSHNKLRVQISTSLIAVILPILTRVKSLFDLGADPTLIADCLGELMMPFAGIRVPGAFDGFEVSMRAILGQQVSVKAATTLMGRVVEAFGTPMSPSTGPSTGLNYLTPTSAQIAQASPEQLASLGIIKRRARSIIALAQAVENRELQLVPYSNTAVTIAQLTALPGIGDWTAHYIALRVLAYPDAFPHGDLALRRALQIDKPTDVLQAAERWRPWRAYAAMCLWSSLESTP